MTIAAQREGLAERIRTISGLYASPTASENITPPMACVLPPRVTYDGSYGRGLAEYEYTIRVFTSRQDVDAAQALFDELAEQTGSRSLKAAIEGDRTLGGAAEYSRVVRRGETGPSPVGETTYLATDFVVLVHAP